MAKPSITDEELNLKRQARRRLIGAVALVLATVVILPMIFDGEPSPGTPNEIELRIPQREALPPLIPQAASEPVASVAPPPVEPPQSAPAAVPVAASAVTPPALPGASPKVEHAASVAAAKPADKPADKSAAKPATKTGWVVQVGAYSNHETAKSMAAKLSKEGFRVYTEKAGNMVRVRIGSYPSREAADKIRLKLEKLGLHPNLVNLEQP